MRARVGVIFFFFFFIVQAILHNHRFFGVLTVIDTEAKQGMHE